jgi:hypothetical protein
MTLGGRPEMVRCTNEPTVVATESEPGPDGQVGAMTLCDECLAAFKKQSAADYAIITPIDEYAPGDPAREAIDGLVDAVRAECAKFHHPDEDRPELWEALQAYDATHPKEGL